MIAEHPLFDQLAATYQFDTLLGWAFEDGPCYCYGFSRSGYDDMGDYICDCSRPWSEAWDELCGALVPHGWDPTERFLVELLNPFKGVSK